MAYPEIYCFFHAGLVAFKQVLPLSVDFLNFLGVERNSQCKFGFYFWQKLIRNKIASGECMSLDVLDFLIVATETVNLCILYIRCILSYIFRHDLSSRHARAFIAQNANFFVGKTVKRHLRNTLGKKVLNVQKPAYDEYKFMLIYSSV